MIETDLGPIRSDSPFQNRRWIWGSDGIRATRSRLDDTVVVMSERDSNVEIDLIEENQYIAPPSP